MSLSDSPPPPPLLLMLPNRRLASAVLRSYTTAGRTASGGESRRTSGTVTAGAESHHQHQHHQRGAQHGVVWWWHQSTVARRTTRDDYPYSQSVIAERLGGMWSPYDGTRFSSLRESDIEHVVAVSEAHDSGLCAASNDVRRRFASDLDNLTLATPQLNRYEKQDDDAADWLPEHNRCWFAATMVAVRKEYGLTIDPREAATLDAVFEGCC